MKNKYDYWSNAKNELCKPTVLDGRLSATRLADSAPDLLAALEACVKQCADYERMTDDCAAAFRNARAAIAKAKGE